MPAVCDGGGAAVADDHLWLLLRAAFLTRNLVEAGKRDDSTLIS